MTDTPTFSDEPPRAPKARLPVGKTINESFASVFRNFNAVARTALIPVLVTAGLNLLAAGLQGKADPFLILLVPLGPVPFVLFAVSWHRFVLLRDHTEAQVVPRWHKAHWAFYGYVCLLLLIGVFMVTIPLSVLAEFADMDQPTPAFFLLAALLALAIYVTLRLVLVLPARAVGETYGLGHSWRHMHGQVGRLFVALVAVFVPLLILVSIMIGAVAGVTVILARALPAFGQYLESALGVTAAILSYLVTAGIISVLSHGFRAVTGWVPPPRDAAFVGSRPGGRP